MLLDAHRSKVYTTRIEKAVVSLNELEEDVQEIYVRAVRMYSDDDSSDTSIYRLYIFMLFVYLFI